MMRTVAEYLKLPYHDRIVRSETVDGEPSWFGTVDELLGLTTSSLTLDDMEAQLQDAKQAWFEAAIELGREIPEPREEDYSTPEYSGRLGLRIAKGLHRAVAEHAALEGISLTQFASNVLAGAVGYGAPPAIAGLSGAQGISALDAKAIVYGATLADEIRHAREDLGLPYDAERGSAGTSR
jgi:antitoxin HicB